jgi:uncharacterized protein YraI
MVGWFTGVSRASRTTVFSAGARTKTYMLDELKPTQVQQRNAQVPCVTGKQDHGVLCKDSHKDTSTLFEHKSAESPASVYDIHHNRTHRVYTHLQLLVCMKIRKNKTHRAYAYTYHS